VRIDHRGEAASVTVSIEKFLFLRGEWVCSSGPCSPAALDAAARDARARIVLLVLEDEDAAHRTLDAARHSASPLRWSLWDTGGWVRDRNRLGDKVYDGRTSRDSLAGCTSEVWARTSARVRDLRTLRSPAGIPIPEAEKAEAAREVEATRLDFEKTRERLREIEARTTRRIEARVRRRRKRR